MMLVVHLCALCAPREDGYGRDRWSTSWDLAGPCGAVEWTSVADELAPGSAAMSAPRTCWIACGAVRRW
jgi:hypothetical protein